MVDNGFNTTNCFFVREGPGLALPVVTRCALPGANYMLTRFGPNGSSSTILRRAPNCSGHSPLNR
eukprot:526903-Amphidinium_carterae.2